MLAGAARVLLWVVGLAGLVACSAPSTPRAARKQQARSVGPTRSDCVACHDRDFADAPVHVDVKPTHCATCHTERAWQPTQLVHAWTLTGAHAQTECSACHKGTDPDYARTQNTCDGCHRKAYELAAAPPHRGFGTSCESCHTTLAWRPASQALTPGPAIARAAARVDPVLPPAAALPTPFVHPVAEHAESPATALVPAAPAQELAPTAAAPTLTLTAAAKQPAPKRGRFAAGTRRSKRHDSQAKAGAQQAAPDDMPRGAAAVDRRVAKASVAQAGDAKAASEPAQPVGMNRAQGRAVEPPTPRAGVPRTTPAAANNGRPPPPAAAGATRAQPSNAAAAGATPAQPSNAAAAAPAARAQKPTVGRKPAADSSEKPRP
jgi:hypothetical protein